MNVDDVEVDVDDLALEDGETAEEALVSVDRRIEEIEGALKVLEESEDLPIVDPGRKLMELELKVLEQAREQLEELSESGR